MGVHPTQTHGRGLELDFIASEHSEVAVEGRAVYHRDPDKVVP